MLLTSVTTRPEMSSSSDGRQDNNNERLSTDSSDRNSDIGWEMAEINYKLRQDGGQSTGMTPSRPLSMKLFASWEVESGSSSCVPR